MLPRLASRCRANLSPDQRLHKSLASWFLSALREWGRGRLHCCQQSDGGCKPSSVYTGRTCKRHPLSTVSIWQPASHRRRSLLELLEKRLAVKHARATQYDALLLVCGIEKRHYPRLFIRRTANDEHENVLRQTSVSRQLLQPAISSKPHLRALFRRKRRPCVWIVCVVPLAVGRDTVRTQNTEKLVKHARPLLMLSTVS